MVLSDDSLPFACKSEAEYSKNAAIVDKKTFKERYFTKINHRVLKLMVKQFNINISNNGKR
jgi:K+/H+ antiporter YhaU regulatory subunit KhtT